MTKQVSPNNDIKYGLLVLFDQHNEELKVKVGAGEVAKSTLTKYKTIRNKVATYINQVIKRDDVPVAKLPRFFCNVFHDYLMEFEGLQHNTAVTYIEMLGKILDIAVQKGLADRNPIREYTQKKIQRTSVDYLSADELNCIEELIITDEKQKLVRDLFLFSCYTGLSYEELKRASIYDIEVEEDGTQWLHAKRGASWDERNTPLFFEAEDIIDRYSAMRKSMDSERIFPYSFPGSTKSLLQKIGKNAGISQPFDFSIARYTFALTYALTNNLSTDLMSSIKGGTLVQKTEQYQVKLNEEVFNEMKVLRQKLRDR